MRLLLIDPYSPNAASLNTSLGWVSASVRAAGHEVFVLSLNTRRIADYKGVLPDFVKRYSPDIIGITVVCTTYTSVLQMVEHLDEYFRGYIVLGGAQMAFEEENALKDSPRADFVVVGEGEETLTDLIEHLDAREDLADVPGLIYRDNGNIKKNVQRKQIADLNELPFPDYRLYGLKKVSPSFTYRISTSRGCPYRCVFCNPRNMQGKWRGRDFALAIEELKFAKAEFGIKRFDICEPVLNLTSERVIEFCELLVREKINLHWTCNSGLRADHITDEMIKCMKATGYYDVKLGVETLSPEVFENINKGETTEDIARAVEIVKRNGLRVSGSFIIGLPESTYKTDLDSFERARKLGFDKMFWSFLIPYPGTPAYRWVLEHGTMYYDYKQAHQYFGEQFASDEKMRVAFETPEYPLAEKMEIMQRISWTLKQAAIGHQNLKLWQKAWQTTFNLMKYNPWDVLGNVDYVRRGVISEFERGRTAEETPYAEFIPLDEILGGR